MEVQIRMGFPNMIMRNLNRLDYNIIRTLYNYTIIMQIISAIISGTYCINTS